MKAFTEYIILEAKSVERFLKKNDNLSKSQKNTINKFFTKNKPASRKFETDYGWQSKKVQNMEWKDFYNFMTDYKIGRKMLLKVSNVPGKKGIDYWPIHIKNKDYIANVPLNWKTAQYMNSCRYGSIDVNYCIGWSDDKSYWKDHVIDEQKVPVYITNGYNKWVVMILEDNHNYEVWDKFNREDSALHIKEPIPGFSIKKELLKKNMGKIYDEIREIQQLESIPDWVKEIKSSDDAIYHYDESLNGVIWEKGTWYGGVWENGIWKKGIWKKGVWKNGEWYDGTWEAGEWYDGWWEDGIWKNGIWHRGSWDSGIWEDGEWIKGIWETGIWRNGVWRDGMWHNGIWKSGDWYGGMWRDGTWENGIWHKGVWKDGTWEGGTWKDGSWEKGIDKHGRRKIIAPSAWNEEDIIENVFSEIDLNSMQKNYKADLWSRYKDFLITLYHMIEGGHLKGKKGNIILTYKKENYFSIENAYVDFVLLRKLKIPEEIKIKFDNCTIKYIDDKINQFEFFFCDILECMIKFGNLMPIYDSEIKGGHFLIDNISNLSASFPDFSIRANNISMVTKDKNKKFKDFDLGNIRNSRFERITPAGNSFINCAFKDCMIYPENLDKAEGCIFIDCIIEDLEEFHRKFGKTNEIQ